MKKPYRDENNLNFGKTWRENTPYMVSSPKLIHLVGLTHHPLEGKKGKGHSPTNRCRAVLPSLPFPGKPPSSHPRGYTGSGRPHCTPAPPRSVVSDSISGPTIAGFPHETGTDSWSHGCQPIHLSRRGLGR